MAAKGASSVRTGAPVGWLAAARRALAVLGVVLLVGTTGALAVDYVRDPRHLPLETIRVTGKLRHLRGAELEAVVARAIDGNFFTVDMGRIRDQVRGLAWVDQVSVRRQWPRTLLMEVTEQVPLARWGDDALVNARGEVFRPDGVLTGVQLARLFGPQGSAERVARFYRAVAPRLAEAGLALRRLGLDARREWRLELDGGLAVMLGQEGRHEERLQRFLQAYPLLGADPQREPVRVDMRYPQGFAVAWRTVGEGVAPREVNANRRARDA